MVQIPPIGLICPCWPPSWGAKWGLTSQRTLQIASALPAGEIFLRLTARQNVKGKFTYGS